jgi:hypothetical protein
VSTQFHKASRFNSAGISSQRYVTDSMPISAPKVNDQGVALLEWEYINHSKDYYPGSLTEKNSPSRYGTDLQDSKCSDCNFVNTGDLASIRATPATPTTQRGQSGTLVQAVKFHSQFRIRRIRSDRLHD